MPCWERERERVPRRVLLPDAGVERRGVHGVELLPWRVDGDDELHCGVVLPRGRAGEPGAVQRGILLSCWSEQPGGVRCGDVLPERGDVGGDGVSCGQGVRRGDGGACCMRRGHLLSGGVVVGDGVSCGQLLCRELGEPERMPLGQLLPCGVCELDNVRSRVLLPKPFG